MDENQKVSQTLALIKQFCPNYKIVLKSQSTVNKVIGWILSKVGNSGYMSDFFTTLGQTTYVPTCCESAYIPGMWQILMHEGQHAQDAAKIGNVTFGVLYLLPQLIGVLGIVYAIVMGILLLCGGPLSLLWGLLALVCLAPIPAFGRAYLEVRGYTVTLASMYWSGTYNSSVIPWIVGNFTGGAYYWMWPFASWTTSYFNTRLQELQNGTFVLTPYLAACKTLSKQINSL